MSNLTNQHTQIAGELPRLILLDRDGVINQDSKDYIKNAEEWAPIKGSLEAIGYWQRRGIEFAVCTNQSGLGRGLFSKDDLFNMHAKCNSILKSLGGKPLRFFFCPHTPENNCSCRKPKALLLELAIEALGSKPSNTVFVGDSPSDLKSCSSSFCSIYTRAHRKWRINAQRVIRTQRAVTPTLPGLTVLFGEFLTDKLCTT